MEQANDGNVTNEPSVIKLMSVVNYCFAVIVKSYQWCGNCIL